MQDMQIPDLIKICKTERDRYRHEQEDFSPACAEIVHRAFQGDQDAWNALYAMFKPLLDAWSRQLVSKARNLGYDECSDIVQEAWLRFYRFAPKDEQLIKDGTLQKFLTYLRKCVYTSIHLLRKPVDFDRVGLDTPNEDGAPLEIASHNRTDTQAESNTLKKQIIAIVQTLLHNEQEEVVFIGRWIDELKPAEIFERNKSLFSSVKEVYSIQQRVDQRLLKSEELRRLLDDLSSLIRPQDKQDETPMDYDCSLDLSDLIDVVLGVASAEVRAAVERSPGCKAAVQQLATELLPLRSVLQRAFCPRTETMVAYHEQRLDSTAALQVRAHVQGCQACQDELALFKAIDAVPLTLRRESLRARIEALFQAPLAQPQPLMGGGVYRTPQIQIDITTDKAPGQPRTWTLWGAIRTSEGLPLNVPVERVTLQPLDQPTAEYPAALEANGGFVISGLPAGGYRLAVLIPDEEIFIRRLVVGDVLDLDGEAPEHDNR